MTGNRCRNIRTHSQAADSVPERHNMRDERGGVRFRQIKDILIERTGFVAVTLISTSLYLIGRCLDGGLLHQCIFG